MAETVFLNGQWLAKDQARVSILDQGILRGDGLFETIRGFRGKIPLLEDHLERIYGSAQLIGITIPFTRAELGRALEESLAKNNLVDGRIRLVVTRGVGTSMDPLEREDSSIKPTVFILAEPIPPHLSETLYQKGVAVLTTPVCVFNELFPISIKSTSYFHNMAAKRYAKAKGAFEAILTDGQGYCTEGSTSNLFWVEEGEVYTTPLYVGALPGVTRRNLMGLLKNRGKTLREEKIHKDELAKKTEVFITSSVMGILPVTEVDGKKIGHGVGPVTRSLRLEFEKHLGDRLSASR